MGLISFSTFYGTINVASKYAIYLFSQNIFNEYLPFSE